MLEYFVGDAKSIRSRCLTARDTLVDKLVDRYRHAMTSFFEEVPHRVNIVVNTVCIKLCALQGCKKVRQLEDSKSHLKRFALCFGLTA